MVTESPANKLWLTEIFVVQSAQTVLEKEVRDKMKKLNAMKHTTQTQEQRLEDLKLQYQSMKPQNRSPLPDTQKQEEEEKVEIVLFLGILDEHWWISQFKNCPGYYFLPKSKEKKKSVKKSLFFTVKLFLTQFLYKFTVFCLKNKTVILSKTMPTMFYYYYYTI